MEVCQGPGPIIEEVGEDEVTPDLSSPTEEATYTTQEPDHDWPHLQAS